MNVDGGHQVALHSPPPLPPPLPASVVAGDMMHPAESDDDEDLKLDDEEGKRHDGVAANHLMLGSQLDVSARMGLQVMMRKKKQKLVSGLSCSVAPLAASGGSSSNNCELDRERPMSWEWESDEDCLSRGMEEMSPSPLPGRFASFDPGSPMSTNDSDKEDGGSLMSPRKCAVDFSQKIFGAPAIPSLTTAASSGVTVGLLTHPTTAAATASTATSEADVAVNMENNLPGTNGASHHHHHQHHHQLPPFFTPTQSPLAPRHVNNAHSYSSSSSPEQIKRLFYSPTQSPLQQRHLLATTTATTAIKLEPPPSYSSSASPGPSPSQTRHAVNKDSANSSSPSSSSSSAAVVGASGGVGASFSPAQSPGQQSRHPHHHGGGRESPYGSPYSSVGSPGGSSVRYSSSPNQSPIQGRHSVLVSGASNFGGNGSAAAAASSSAATASDAMFSSPSHTPAALLMGGDEPLDQLSPDFGDLDDKSGLNAELLQHASLTGQTGISRQQLINSPCPICGDRISGFHYGIFSCESCKGFFKRTVQNKKNYVCLRGASCPISTTTRKKCPACRFDKCLKRGMKLEAIREDRTRGGRSTYQCTYALPPSLASSSSGEGGAYGLERIKGSGGDRSGDESDPMVNGSGAESTSSKASSHGSSQECSVPNLIQEIMSVEHLWYYSEAEVSKLPESVPHVVKPFDASSNSDFFGNLCNIADHRLYKIVKWCKSLPLFRNVSIDDQICLLLNSWCQLLLLSCCYRSIPTPEEIRVSLGKSVSLRQARTLGLGPIIERMLNLTDHLRRLRVDQHEYVCLKVIILLTSDVGGLKEPEKVRHAQERVIQALQTYTMTRYADHPSKFGELLLRIPELERTCQIGKDSLSMKHREGEVPSFNLLVELLRGEH